jgi:hypothetical protein
MVWPPQQTPVQNYRTSPVCAVQAHSLQPRDSAARKNCCKWFIKSVNEGAFDRQLLLLLMKYDVIERDMCTRADHFINRTLMCSVELLQGG